VYGHRVQFVAVGALLEREPELAALRDGIRRARSGAGTLLLIEGPAGVGKTELAREARAIAEHGAITALEARGSELEQPFPFGVVRQLLEPVIARAASHDALFAGAAAPAARLFDSSEQRGGIADVGFEALHSLYWLLVNLSDRTPLLVSIDDCQWADRESLRFVSYLAQRIDGLPVAVLLTGRPPDPGAADGGRVWMQLASRPSTLALYPRPLSVPSVVALTRERLGAEADEDFCRACHSATGGNPLFLHELLGALDAAGIVPSSGAAGEVQSVGPAAVRRFVLHRLAALGPAATALARAVAVLGDDSELELAAGVAGLRGHAAREAADDLIRAEIFARGVRLGFVHPIVRAALYEDLLPGERDARHAAVAEALMAVGAAAERVTAHLLLTTVTRDPRRVSILRAAAIAAFHSGSPRAAAERLSRALAESSAEQERAEILTELGRCELAEMQFAAAEAHLRACLASGADVGTRADAASWLGRCAIVSGGHSADAAVDALAAVAEEIRPLDPERSLELGAELLMIPATVLRLRPSRPAHLERFREQARNHPGFQALARIHDAQELLFGGGSAEVATDQAQAALLAGLPPNTQLAAALLALHLLSYGERYDVAARALDAALDRARSEGHAARQGIIHGQRAAIALAQGKLYDAQVEADTGLRLIEPAHFAFMQLISVAIIVHIERGAIEDAAELARVATARGDSEDRTHVGEFLLARGRLRIAQGRTREACADLLWCCERMEAVGVLWPVSWKGYAACALASLGERDRAAELAREQLQVARSVRAQGSLGVALRLAAAAGPHDGRLELLEEAVSVLERTPARLELAHALADLGSELSRLGRRREGRNEQRKAIALAEECGALALLERARTELHSGPGRRARTELTGRSALTAAEWRVCHQAASGLTNREIAQALFVTDKTIERHLSSAYHKLGIRSRFQLSSAIGE
jgi:DNA-binding CsgD family transcriptional regulator